MWNWYVWLGLGLALFAFTTFFTFLWWKVGDQWADSEYKRFGHGGGAGPDLSQATVIKDFDKGGSEKEQPEMISDPDPSPEEKSG